MSQGETTSRHPKEGDPIELRRDGGTWLRGVVTAVDDEAFDVVLKADLAEGEVLSACQTIRGDARYTAHLEVVEPGRGRSRLRLRSAWKRVQMRDFVRVSVYGVDLEVTPDSPRMDTARKRDAERLARIQENLEGARRRPRLADISAGGLRFESNEGFEEGDKLAIAFHLPSAGKVSVSGEVVRVLPADGEMRLQNQYGVRFHDVDESTRVRIMTWVFGEQARRFREKKGQPDD